MVLIVNKKSDVSIKWPENSSRIEKIAKSGKCPSHVEPLKLKVPGGWVHLTNTRGETLLSFQVERIEKGIRIQAANGKWYDNRCNLIAKKSTIQTYSFERVPVSRYPIGSLAYFNKKLMRRVIYQIPTPVKVIKRTIATGVKGLPNPTRLKFLADTKGMQLNKPELDLVKRYAEYTCYQRNMIQYKLPSENLFIDIFLPIYYTIIEAKATMTRVDMRQALGQLLDYQRFFKRKPSLAVLLPNKPDDSIIKLFSSKNIAIIWEKADGYFKDNVDGKLTTNLRRTYQSGYSK